MDSYIEHIKEKYKYKPTIITAEHFITDKELELINEEARKDKDLFCIEKE